MPSYIVSTTSSVDWHDDRAAFASAFKERWPDAEIREYPPGSPMALTFEMQEQGEPVLGRLHGNGHAVDMDADVPAAAEIAAWWRARVPVDVAVMFYDDAYNTNVPVEPGADGPTIAAAYLAT
jgi:hypothetical protein